MKQARWLGCLLLLTLLRASDESIVPQGGFPASRYEVLWTDSPFSGVSPLIDVSDLTLVGLARIDDVLYANLQERKSGLIFVLTSTKPVRGLTLQAVHRGSHPEDSYAVILHDHQPTTLYLKSAGAVRDEENSGRPSIEVPPASPTPQLSLTPAPDH